MSGNRVVDENEVPSAVSSHRHAEKVPYKVGAPPKQSLVDEFKFTFKETFFHDDPLRGFKNQSKPKKFLLGLQAVFPIIEWGRRYKLPMLKGDLIAGLTIASLCIPQDIAYARLAGLNPKYGLYSSFVAPLVYAFMGTSRDIAIGPVAVVSLLLGSLLQKELDQEKNKTEYENLAFTATFFAGVIQCSLGVFRLGFLIDYLSHAAIVGFMGGAAFTISLQQFKGLLGIKKFTKKTDIVSVMRSVANTSKQWDFETMAIGLSFLVFLLATKYIAKKKKKLFWVSAIAPLTSVILATFFVYITHANKKGVAIVTRIDQGINPSSVDRIYFTGHYLSVGIKIGLISGMVALTEAVAIGRTFAAMKDYHLDGNTEMIALGSMNIAGSLTSGYVATGSFSRSAVNYMAGCNTAVSNIVMSLTVCLTLLVITPLFKYTPNAVLASIIISAVVGLFDYEAMKLIWKIDKFDFLACMGAFFGVVFITVEMGLLISVAISFVKILLQVTRPRTAVLGKIPRTAVYRNIQQYPDATKIPGFLIVRIDSAIYFSNSNYIRERLLRLLADEDEQHKELNQQIIQYLIIDMSPVTDIDTSGIHSMEDLVKNLNKRDVKLVLANPGPAVLDKFHASDFANMIGDDSIFLSVADAVMALTPKTEP